LNYSLDIIPGTEIVLFHWTGAITLEDRRGNRNKIIEFCQKKDIRNVIIDGRDQESKTGTWESYLFGTELSEKMIGFKIAIIFSKEDDSLPFIDTVAANRGINCRSFVSLEEARAWIDSP